MEERRRVTKGEEGKGNKKERRGRETKVEEGKGNKRGRGER